MDRGERETGSKRTLIESENRRDDTTIITILYITCLCIIIITILHVHCSKTR